MRVQVVHQNPQPPPESVKLSKKAFGIHRYDLQRIEQRIQQLQLALVPAVGRQKQPGEIVFRNDVVDWLDEDVLVGHRGGHRALEQAWVSVFLVQRIRVRAFDAAALGSSATVFDICLPAYGYVGEDVVLAFAGAVVRPVPLGLPRGFQLLLRGMPGPGDAHRQIGAPLGTPGLLQPLQVELPEAPLARLVLRARHLHEALVQRQVVPDGVLQTLQKIGAVRRRTEERGSHLPARMRLPVVQKVLPDPVVDGAQGHLVPVLPHRHADEGGVRERRFLVAVLLVVVDVDGEVFLAGVLLLLLGFRGNRRRRKVGHGHDVGDVVQPGEAGQIGFLDGFFLAGRGGDGVPGGVVYEAVGGGEDDLLLTVGGYVENL